MDTPANEEGPVEQSTEDKYKEEFDKFKEATAKDIAQFNEQIDALKKENDELRSALVRATLITPTPAPEPEHIPTEQEIYEKRLANAINVVKQAVKGELT